MNRRGFLRTTLAGAGAAVGAMLAGKVDAKEPKAIPVPNGTITLPPQPLPSAEHLGWLTQKHAMNAALATQSEWVFDRYAETMARVTGPDPATIVNVAFRTDGTVIVLPHGTPLLSPKTVDRWMGIERAVFPQSDPRHGAVTIYDPASHLLPPDEWTVPMIRAHYLYALGQRTPDKPVDGNHLAVRFLSNAMMDVYPTLNGEIVLHVGESYDGPDGWVVQFELGERGTPIVTDWDTDRARIRGRILTGNVEHWMDGATFSPGDYTGAI